MAIYGHFLNYNQHRQVMCPLKEHKNGPKGKILNVCI